MFFQFFKYFLTAKYDERNPNPKPIKPWSNKTHTTLFLKNSKQLKPINMFWKLSLNEKSIIVKTIKENTAAKNPHIIPWTKKGPLINPFFAPTNLIISISSFCEKILNLKVLNVTIMAINDKNIVKDIPNN